MRGLGGSSSGSREKSSLLYNGLKKKLAYETAGPDMGPSPLGGSNLAIRKAESGSIGLGAGVSSAKSIRPQSAAAQIAAQSLRVANQKSEATNASGPILYGRAPLPKHKNDNRSDANADLFYGNRRPGQPNINNSGGTSGSLQGQGVGDVYDNSRHMGGIRALEPGTRLESDEDYEAHVISGNARILAGPASSHSNKNLLADGSSGSRAFARHPPLQQNSNHNNLLGASAAANKLRSGPMIVETISEEPTYRNNRSVERNP